jgi:hypothetical protein
MGNSNPVRDPRRRNDGGTPNDPDDDTLDPAPLGADPDFVSFNFQVTATLRDGSDPALCTEGQEARGTVMPAGLPAVQKMACTAGRDLPVCTRDAECNSFTCQGGARNGQSCNDQVSAAACLVGGGRCRSNADGRCTPFPFAGANRGNDDYRRDFPADLGGLKLHSPANAPSWVDFVGQGRVPRALAPRSFVQQADFLAFVRGPAGNCSCHFRLVVDWDQATRMFRAATGLTLVADAETVNCRLNPP